jgi:hypothetical protein
MHFIWRYGSIYLFIITEVYITCLQFDSLFHTSTLEKYVI